jgi:hypothetical protein
VIFVDSDWAGDVADRKSTAAHVVFYKGCPSWNSRKIVSTVSLSSTEAEGTCDGGRARESLLYLQPMVEEVGMFGSGNIIHFGGQFTSFAHHAGVAIRQKAKHFVHQDQVLHGHFSGEQNSYA